MQDVKALTPVAKRLLMLVAAGNKIDVVVTVSLECSKVSLSKTDSAENGFECSRSIPSLLISAFFREQTRHGLLLLPLFNTEKWMFVSLSLLKNYSDGMIKGHFS